MKVTTVSLPDELHRAARAEVGRRRRLPGGRGYSLGAYVEELIRRDLLTSAPSGGQGDAD